MTEDEARDWIRQRYSPDQVGQLTQFVDLVVAETMTQNLIAPSTIAAIWSRHVVDSAQLMAFAENGDTWLDVGTGGGFPGMVVAILHPGLVTLVEPRRRRADFLQRAADALHLESASVLAIKVERAECQANIISARAVSSPEKLLQATRHCATLGTRWILPIGRSEFEAPKDQVFHVKHSITDRTSRILVIENKT